MALDSREAAKARRRMRKRNHLTRKKVTAMNGSAFILRRLQLEEMGKGEKV
jgi:hypothetical protein